MYIYTNICLETHIQLFICKILTFTSSYSHSHLYTQKFTIAYSHLYPSTYSYSCTLTYILVDVLTTTLIHTCTHKYSVKIAYIHTETHTNTHPCSHIHIVTLYIYRPKFPYTQIWQSHTSMQMQPLCAHMQILALQTTRNTLIHFYTHLDSPIHMHWCSHTFISNEHFHTKTFINPHTFTCWSTHPHKDTHLCTQIHARLCMPIFYTFRYQDTNMQFHTST